MLTKHHLYWPKRDYRSPLEKQFRSLPCNIQRLTEKHHHHLHLTQKPPLKPEADYMRQRIAEHNNGACACKSEIGLGVRSVGART